MSGLHLTAAPHRVQQPLGLQPGPQPRLRHPALHRERGGAGGGAGGGEAGGGLVAASGCVVTCVVCSAVQLPVITNHIQHCRGMHTHATPHDDTFTLPLSFLYRVFALLIFPTVPIPQGPGTRRSRVGMETITCGWGAAAAAVGM